MDKTIILGGYEFLGFHLTTEFLERGDTVKCVHAVTSNDYYLDEKRFMVGRNANFSEMPMKDWRSFSFNPDEKNLIIISLYDFFLKNGHENVIPDIESSFEDLLERGNLKNCQVVFILPIQILKCEEHSFLNIYNRLENKKLKLKCIYLPTLYGPWQPIEYVFQQALLNEVNGEENLCINEKEWVFDAIYISDAVEQIMTIIENDTLKECVFNSSCSDHWRKCAEYLSISPKVYRSAFKLEKIEYGIPQIEVEPHIEFQQGLKQQKLHLLRILSDV